MVSFIISIFSQIQGKIVWKWNWAGSKAIWEYNQSFQLSWVWPGQS